MPTRTSDHPDAVRRPPTRRDRRVGTLDRGLLALARRLAVVRPLEPCPGWSFGDRDPGWRSFARFVVWKVAQRRGIDDPVWIPWSDGLVVAQHLGNDVSRCLYVGGRYEPNELSWWARRLGRGQSVVDVGANEGLFTVLAASRVGETGRVLAVEPSPRERRRLVQNLDRNLLDGVEVVAEALVDRPGPLTLQVAEPAHAGQNTLGGFMYSTVSGEAAVEVAGTTLDELVARHGLARLDLVKVDVEGAETKVFEGASDVLDRLRPLILVELEDVALHNQGSSAAELEALLTSHGYRLLPFDRASGRPTDRYRPTSRDANVVACPVERVAEVVAAERDSGAPKALPITMFSTTRAFDGLFGVIQRNALTSWAHVQPRPEVLIFGDDPGAAEICDALGFTHIPDVATSDLGTPLVSDMFTKAQARASHDICCFLNSDIIVFPDFSVVAAAVAEHFDRYLVVGQRHDLDIAEDLPFEPGWSDELRGLVDQKGRLQPEVAIDYFVFRTGTITDIPPFAIGRGAYDNWLIWYCGEAGMAVVDATPFTTVVHQTHDYSHAGGLKAVWEGPEAQRAHEMIGHWSRYHAVAHARSMVDPSGAVVPARGLKYRLARPRRFASQAVRFTRPARRWLKYELAYRLRGRSA